MKKLSGARGGLFIEALAAMLVLGMVGTAVLAGVSMTQKSGTAVEEQSVAENLVRNQMEYIFSLPYVDPGSSYASVSAPSGYTVTNSATEFVAGDTNIEKITVTVQRGSKSLLTLETLRTRQ
jgi:Tfp pilus assembly protein PilV